MAEEQTVYRGHPSPVTVIGSLSFSLLLIIGLSVAVFFFWNALPPPPMRYGVFALFLIPLVILLSKWIQLRLLSYEITTERIRLTRGLFTRRTDELELYRVKDSALVEPFLYRVFGVGNIVVTTNDTTTPELDLTGIKRAKEVREQLRSSVEKCRVSKGARVMEME